MLHATCYMLHSVALERKFPSGTQFLLKGEQFGRPTVELLEIVLGVVYSFAERVSKEKQSEFTMFSCNQDKFTKQVGVIIPTDFYDVRAATPPKAGWTLMFSASILIYSAAIVAFALLFSYESGRSTVETIVVAGDKTGTDGYTCQMISRVTASYQIPSYGNPALAYNLVNLMESQQECKDNMAATSPCNTSMLYFPGTATALNTGGATLGAAAMFGTNLVYVYSTKSPFSDIVGYDYSRGQYNIFTSVYEAQPNSLAVDINGYPIYVGLEIATGTSMLVLRAYFGSDVPDTIGFDTESLSTLVFNDNLYNIYYSTEDSFYALNVYSDPAVSTLLFQFNVGETLRYAAVFHDEVSPTVYYWTSSGQTYYLYSFNSGNVITLLQHYVPGGLVVDGLNNLYVLTQSEGYYTLARYHPNEEESLQTMTFLDTNTVPSGVAINPVGERIIFLFQDRTEEEKMSFYYTQQYNGPNSLVNPEEVKIMNGFGATWFTCGDKLLNGTAYSPGAVAEYPDFCAQNGVAGKVVYKNDYTLTTTDASAYAVQNSVIHCPKLFDPICERISDLPPYSCSRTLQQGFFSSAATAFANAQFLVQILILICAVVLPYAIGISPVVPRSNGDSVASDAQPDIELAVKVTQNNPMR